MTTYYYQKHKEKLRKKERERYKNLSEEENEKRRKKARDRYQNLSEEEKEKKASVNVTRIFLKSKSKSKLVI